jgi:hypothetical protein
VHVIIFYTAIFNRERYPFFWHMLNCLLWEVAILIIFGFCILLYRFFSALRDFYHSSKAYMRLCRERAR